MSELKILASYQLDKDVQAYLSEFPFLEQVLEEAYPQIMRLFGEDTEIVLKVVVDHEIPDWRTLFAYIWTELGVDEALTLEEQLFDKWYVHLPANVRLKMNYSVKCR